MLATGQLRNEQVLLGTDAEVLADEVQTIAQRVAVDEGVALGDVVETREDVDQRRFSRSVVAEQDSDLSLVAATHLSSPHLQCDGEVIDGDNRLVFFLRRREGLGELADADAGELRRVGVDRFHLLEVLDDLLFLGLLFGSHLLAGGEAEAAGLAGSVAVLRNLSQIVSEEAPEDERDKQ